MSTDQAGLDEDWSTRKRQPVADLRKKALQGGARYGQPSERASKTVNGPTNQCLGCGRAISSGVARVVGDENGCTPVCGDCDPVRENTVPAVADYYGDKR